MARITVEDCLKRVPNRFLLVNMVAKRVRQLREGSEYLVRAPKNEDVVVALREIAAGKVGIRPPEEALPPPAKEVFDLLADAPTDDAPTDDAPAAAGDDDAAGTAEAAAVEATDAPADDDEPAVAPADAAQAAEADAKARE